MPASPRSMTGYGAARADGSRLGVEIEIRSVNARSFKLNMRSPPLLAPHESDIEALVRKTVRRGTVSLHTRVDLLRPEDTVRVRHETVEGLLRDVFSVDLYPFFHVDEMGRCKQARSGPRFLEHRSDHGTG